jgi:hypothetical protein
MEPTQIIKDKARIDRIIARMFEHFIKPKQLELNLTHEYVDID